MPIFADNKLHLNACLNDSIDHLSMYRYISKLLLAVHLGVTKY